MKISTDIFFKNKYRAVGPNSHSRIHYFVIVRKILEMFSIRFKACRKKMIKGIRKYTYMVTIDTDIKNIVEHKYGKRDNVPGWNKLYQDSHDE